MKIQNLFPPATIISLNLFGYAANANYNAHHHHNHGHTHVEEGHQHGVLEIPTGTAVPQVDLIVHQDAKLGWNLEIRTTNFQFAPESVNQASTYNEGHAHLYVNGKKITRLYSNWYYLSQLEPGRNEVKVSLNANGHEALSYQGAMIEDLEIIEVK